MILYYILGDPDGSQGYSDSSSVGSSVPMSDQELSPEEKAALHKVNKTFLP